MTKRNSFLTKALHAAVNLALLGQFGLAVGWLLWKLLATSPLMFLIVLSGLFIAVFLFAYLLADDEPFTALCGEIAEGLFKRLEGDKRAKGELERLIREAVDARVPKKRRQEAYDAVRENIIHAFAKETAGLAESSLRAAPSFKEALRRAAHIVMDGSDPAIIDRVIRSTIDELVRGTIEKIYWPSREAIFAGNGQPSRAAVEQEVSQILYGAPAAVKEKAVAGVWRRIREYVADKTRSCSFCNGRGVITERGEVVDYVQTGLTYPAPEARPIYAHRSRACPRCGGRGTTFLGAVPKGGFRAELRDIR